MAIKIAQKKEIVKEVAEVASEAVSAVLADYRGMSVAQMTAKKALEGSEFSCLEGSLVGPTLVAFSQEDPGAAARLLKEYSKEIEDLQVKAIAIGGESFGPEQIDRVAKLPTLDEARSMLMSVLLAPITKLTRTLNEVPSKIVRVLAAVRDEKQNNSS